MSTMPLRKRIRVKTLLLAMLCAWLWLLYADILIGDIGGLAQSTVGDALLASNEETGSANVVTSVVTHYRGFDTLGEITILFLAATGIGLLFRDRNTQTARTPERVPPNEMMVTGVRLLFPILLLLGVYIVVHGHLSPGGGFQGGVVIATAFFLRMLGDPGFTLDEGRLGFFESFSGSAFVLIGLAGLMLATTATFLGNLLPHPVAAMGRLISAGIIPILSIAIGVKVGAEVGGIFQDMVEQDRQVED